MIPLRIGSPAPELNCLDINNKKYSLKDFKGKYIYIDVWSTKCGPCIREIPFLKKFAENNKNVTVLSISIDNSIEEWKKMVTEKNLTGIQLHAENGWRSKFAKDYIIKSTPTYILIDKDGKIKSIRAPGPRENIQDLIKE